MTIYRLTKYNDVSNQMPTLRKAHVDQLQFCLEYVEREGTYYGKKGDFIKRALELKTILEHLSHD